MRSTVLSLPLRLVFPALIFSVKAVGLADSQILGKVGKVCQIQTHQPFAGRPKLQPLQLFD
jgi:hypothetical protein